MSIGRLQNERMLDAPGVSVLRGASLVARRTDSSTRRRGDIKHSRFTRLEDPISLDVDGSTDRHVGCWIERSKSVFETRKSG